MEQSSPDKYKNKYEKDPLPRKLTDEEIKAQGLEPTSEKVELKGPPGS